MKSLISKQQQKKKLEIIMRLFLKGVKTCYMIRCGGYELIK